MVPGCLHICLHNVGLSHSALITTRFSSDRCSLYTTRLPHGWCAQPTVKCAENAQNSKWEVTLQIYPTHASILLEARTTLKRLSGDDFLSYRSPLVDSPVSRLVLSSARAESAAMGYSQAFPNYSGLRKALVVVCLSFYPYKSPQWPLQSFRRLSSAVCFSLSCFRTLLRPLSPLARMSGVRVLSTKS
jgi:hypothetical protein